MSLYAVAVILNYWCCVGGVLVSMGWKGIVRMKSAMKSIEYDFTPGCGTACWFFGIGHTPNEKGERSIDVREVV